MLGQILARHPLPLVAEMSCKENLAMSPKPVLKKRFTLISLGFLLAMALMAFVLPRRPARADEKTPFRATLPVAQTSGSDSVMMMTAETVGSTS